MSIYFYTIISVVAVSLISLIGLATLSLSPARVRKLVVLLVGLSAGTLLGDALLHLMPEAVSLSNNSFSVWISLLAGMFAFFVLEKVIHWRHCHHETSSHHSHPVGIMNLIGDTVHNFLDGAIIAGSYMVNPILGLTTTLAVISHEIPHEMGNFGILLYAGYTRKKALMLNFLTALAAILGAATTLIIGPQINSFNHMIVPLTAGGFLYIASSDLIPEMKEHDTDKQNILQFSSFIFGLLLMLAFKLLIK